MTDKPKVPSPVGLSLSGRRFFRAVTGIYTLRVDELLVLEDDCREMDLIKSMEDELAKSTPIVAGRYRGSRIPNPVLDEIRKHRVLKAQLLKQLGLPDPDVDATAGRESQSTRARRAAATRWAD